MTTRTLHTRPAAPKAAAMFTAAAMLAAAVALTLAAPPAGAADPVEITVTIAEDITNAGDGETSLREAIAAASSNSEDTIVHLPAEAELELTNCASGGMAHNAAQSLTLEGNGSTIRQTCTGANILASYNEADVTVRDVTLTGGTKENGCCAGALNVFGHLTLERSTIEGNSTEDGSGGGGIHVQGPATIRDSVIRDNSTTHGSGAARITGTVLIERSTIVGNTAASSGGAFILDSGGTITNSTFVGNTSPDSTILAFGPLSLWHNVFVDNDVNVDIGGPEFHLGGNVFAPQTRSCGDGGTKMSHGHNLSTDASCEFTDTGDVQNIIDIGLRPLFRNGGLTPTMYPRAESPVLDKVPLLDPELPPVDQRGVSRPQGSLGDIGAVEVMPCGTQFSDITFAYLFCWEIGWLVASGVTLGYPDGAYKPNLNITRGAMAAFLYRLSGNPTFVPPATPSFTDVPTTHLFYTEIEWLADTGITGGFNDGTFGVNRAVTRGAMAAFLYRLAGEPPFTPSATPSFTDVPTTHLFYTEIEWLADTGITLGQGDGSFGVDNPVTRGSMAAFLYRALDGVLLLM